MQNGDGRYRNREGIASFQEVGVTFWSGILLGRPEPLEDIGICSN